MGFAILREIESEDKKKKNKSTNWFQYDNVFVSNTLLPGERGTLKMLDEYQDLIRVRYYKDKKTGEIRKTVEIPAD